MFARLEAVFVAVNRWILIVLLLMMVAIVFTNVVLRYTTGDSLVWAEEVARHMMIWCTFLGAGLVFRFGGHVAIDAMQKTVPSSMAMLLRILVVMSVAAFCVVMCLVSYGYLALMRFQTTPATGIAFSYVYAALPVGFGLLLLHLAFIAPGYLRSGAYVASDEIDADTAASL